MHPQCASVRREMRTRRMESRILLLEGKVRMCHARLQEQEELHNPPASALSSSTRYCMLVSADRSPLGAEDPLRKERGVVC